mgnify:CR=1 FL=1
MSENGKQVVSLRPLRAETALSSGEEWQREVGRWQALIRSGGLPKHIRSPEMAIAIVRMGEEYGWNSMRSLRSIYIVEGRPEMSAESMLSLIREKCPESLVSPVEMSDKRVTIRVTRPPQVPEPVEVTVSIDQFQHLMKKDNWRNYPGDMLWARCVSRVARRIFPDVTAGAYTLGEIEESVSYTTRQVSSKREIAMPGAAQPVDVEAEDVDQRPEVEPEDESQDAPEPVPASAVETEQPADYDEPPEDWTPGEAP